MTKQGIFDKVAAHLLKQNAQAVSSIGGCVYGCVYRSTQGLSCAIGCLLSDEAYNKDIENRAVDNQYVQRALAQSGIDLEGINMDFLVQLQNIHDIYPPQDWPQKLISFAAKWSLKVNFPVD